MEQSDLQQQSPIPPQSFAILGIHDESVEGVTVPVARVRMFVGDQAIDEDITLPHLITVEEQLDAAVNTRIAELQQQVAPADSQVVQGDGNQVVNDQFTIPADITPAPATADPAQANAPVSEAV